MNNALTKIGFTCSGERPWLGEEAERNNTQHCGQQFNSCSKRCIKCLLFTMLEVQFICLNGKNQLTEDWLKFLKRIGVF